MMRLVLLLLVLAGSARAECVILLHGLQGRPAVMAPMAVALADRGYVVFNGGYPSTEATIEELADFILPRALAACPKGPVHVVGHSMGGLLYRYWQAKTDRIERVVLIGTPNGGSELVDTFSGWPFYRSINGPAAEQMGTDGLVLGLAPPRADIGVVIGTESRSWLFSTVIPGPDDGRVSVKSAQLEGAKQVVVAVDHNSMPLSPVVFAHVVAFLETGRFLKAGF